MLRHCTVQEVLEIRDGEGSVAAKAHVDQCERCREELERLHQRAAAMRALPSLRPPRDRWPATRERVLAERRQARWIRSGWLSLAAAAVLVLFVGTDGVFQAAADEQPADAGSELSELMQHSDELEAALGEAVARVRVVDGLTALVIADLEDELVLLDSRIATARRAARTQRELTDLMRERVALMDALVNTHVRRVSSVGY